MQWSRLVVPIVLVAVVWSGGIVIGSAGETLEMGREGLVEKKSTVFVVIVPPPKDGGNKGKCRIVPDPRVIPAGTEYMTVLNLAAEKMTVQVPDEIADTERPFVQRVLGKDEYFPVKLRRMEPGEYLFSIEGRTGGCLPGELPNPKIVIP